MIKISALLVSLLVVITAGCSITKLPPTNAYTISIAAIKEKPVEQATSNKIIRVAIPRSTAAIMSRNILYQDRRHSLNAYAFSKWSDTPNRMLANLFLTSIGDSYIFKVALPSDSRGKSNYTLESSLQQFHQQINGDGTSTASVRIGFYLIETKSGGVVDAIEFTSTEKATSIDADGGVEALNRASEAINKKLLAWLASLKL